MLVKSQMFGQLSGSAAATTAARNRYGQYLRARTIPVNPRSAAQEEARERLVNLSTAWRDTLTAVQRQGWTDYANASPVTNRLGDTVTLTGLAAYVRTNAIRLTAGQPRQDIPPTLFGQIADGAISVSATPSTSATSLTFATSAAWNVADGALLVFCGPPQPQSINFYAGPFKYAGTITGGGSTSPATVSNPYGANTSGARIFVRVRAVDGQGRPSPEHILSADVA